MGSAGGSPFGINGLPTNMAEVGRERVCERERVESARARERERVCACERRGVREREWRGSE